jgi:hypothetical protein
MEMGSVLLCFGTRLEWNLPIKCWLLFYIPNEAWIGMQLYFITSAFKGWKKRLVSQLYGKRIVKRETENNKLLL